MNHIILVAIDAKTNGRTHVGLQQPGKQQQMKDTGCGPTKLYKGQHYIYS